MTVKIMDIVMPETVSVNASFALASELRVEERKEREKQKKRRLSDDEGQVNDCSIYEAYPLIMGYWPNRHDTLMEFELDFTESRD